MVVGQKPIYLHDKTAASNMTLVAFDLDDTLYKEHAYVKSALRHIADFLGNKYGLIADELFLEMSRSKVNHFDALYGYLSTKGYVIEETISDLLKLYRNHFPNINLDKETLDALKQIVETCARLAIITDGRAIGQIYKVLALGLDKFVPLQNLSISEVIGSDKHSAGPFMRMMKRNADCDTFVYIGDNPEKDFIWPNRLGWTTIMLLDKTNENIHSQDTENRNSSSLAQYEISSIAELPSLLKIL